mgnify:FL=1
MISYFVLRTAPQREFRATNEFIRRGYQAFCPIETKWEQRVKTKGRTRGRRYPMFIRYAFLGCEDIYAAWTEMRSDPDVHPKLIQGVGPLGFSGVPYRLTPSEVASLMSMSTKAIPYGRAPNPHKAHLAVSAGQTAVIVEGPLAGRKGHVSKVAGKNATVMVEMFASMQEVQIPVAKLEAVS